MNELLETSIPEHGDILTELPSVGDSMKFETPIDDSDLDLLLQEIEGYFMDDYYSEDS